MGCNDCKKTTPYSSTKCFSCDDCCDRKNTELMLELLRQCRPDCGSNCSTSACPIPVVQDGEKGYMVQGHFVGGGFDCGLFGPASGSKLVDADLTAIDAEAVIDAYSIEKSKLVPIVPHPDHPGWYIGLLGPIGISHKLCLEDIECIGVDAASQLVPVELADFGVAGGLWGCATGDETGSGKWFLRRPCKPLNGWKHTEFLCRCEPAPCSATSAEGVESFWVKPVSPLPVGVIPASVRVTIKRCGWFHNYQNGTCPPASRVNLDFWDNGNIPSRRFQKVPQVV